MKSYKTIETLERAIPRPPTKIEITIPCSIINWATKSKENWEILADVIFDYINYRIITNSKITFIEYLRSDGNES